MSRDISKAILVLSLILLELGNTCNPPNNDSIEPREKSNSDVREGNNPGPSEGYSDPDNEDINKNFNNNYIDASSKKNTGKEVLEKIFSELVEGEPDNFIDELIEKLEEENRPKSWPVFWNKAEDSNIIKALRLIKSKEHHHYLEDWKLPLLFASHDISSRLDSEDYKEAKEVYKSLKKLHDAINRQCAPTQALPTEKKTQKK